MESIAGDDKQVHIWGRRIEPILLSDKDIHGEANIEQQEKSIIII